MNQPRTGSARGWDYWRLLGGWALAMIALFCLVGWIGVQLAAATGSRGFSSLPFVLIAFGGGWLRRLLLVKGWID